MYGIDTDRIFLGNGSDEAIDLLFRAFCKPGIDEVISIDPSYGMYEVSAKINDVAFRKVLLNPDFSLNTEALLQACNTNSKMMFLCSPNNPTSNLLDETKMLNIAGQFAGLLIVDEAYIDFSGSGGMLKYITEVPNLVVLRTFLKSMGTCWYTTGYGLCFT